MYHLNDQHKYITSLRYTYSSPLYMCVRVWCPHSSAHDCLKCFGMRACREAGRRVCTTFSTYHESVEEENLVTMAMGVLLELRADEREKTLINMLADYEYRYDDSSDMHSSSNNSDDDDENGDSALEQPSYSSLSRSKESIKPALRRPSIAVRSPLSFSLSSLPTLQQPPPLNQHQPQPGTNASPTFHSPYLSYSSFSPASFFVPLAPRPAYVPSAAYARNGSAIGLPASHRKPLLAVRTFNIPQLVSHLGLKNISSPVGDDAKRPEASLCLQDELETADGTVPPCS